MGLLEGQEDEEPGMGVEGGCADLFQPKRWFEWVLGESEQEQEQRAGGLWRGRLRLGCGFGWEPVWDRRSGNSGERGQASTALTVAVARQQQGWGEGQRSQKGCRPPPAPSDEQKGPLSHLRALTVAVGTQLHGLPEGSRKPLTLSLY